MQKSSKVHLAGKVTRTVKFNVSFPGMRGVDLFGDRSSKDEDKRLGLQGRLIRAQQDLTKTMNRAMFALCQLHLGALEHPADVVTKTKLKRRATARAMGYEKRLQKARMEGKPDPTFPEEKLELGQLVPVSVDTLSYQCFSGDWQPFGEEMYNPPHRKVASNVCAGAARSILMTQFNKYVEEMEACKVSVPSFKMVPLVFPAVSRKKVEKGVKTGSYEIKENGDIILKVWAGTTKKLRATNSILLRPSRLQGSGKAQYNRIKSGEYRAGDIKLSFDSRKRKWQVSIAWTGTTSKPTGEARTAGIDLGWATHVTIAYVSDDGVPLMYSKKAKRPTHDLVNIPNTAIRAWNRAQAEVSERLRFNKDIYDLRTGRGRERKMRPIEVIRDKKARVVENAILTTAAAVIRQLQKRGVTRVVLEHLTGITQHSMNVTAGLKGKARSRARRKHLEWHQGALRAAISSAALKAGIDVVEVLPAYTSKTCHKCGLIWTDTAPSKVADRLKIPVSQVTIAPKRRGFGRISQPRFRCTCMCECAPDAKRCTCGCGIHADLNAAINIARRGLVEAKVEAYCLAA